MERWTQLKLIFLSDSLNLKQVENRVQIVPSLEKGILMRNSVAQQY